MKKVSVIFAMLAMVFAITFTACRNTGTTEAEGTEEAAPAVEEAAPAQEAAPAEAPTESTDGGTQQQ